MEHQEENGNQPSEETFLGRPGGQSESGACQDQRQPGVRVNYWELQQSQGVTLQLEFQDSNLSPALPLLPLTSEVEHNFTECSFSQQSNPDFAPLRAYPDVSVAFERFGDPPQDCTTCSMEQSSLSQYPLAQATILSEEKTGSCFILSQHSLSTENKSKEKERTHLSAISDNEQGILSRESTCSSERESETQTNLRDKHTGGIDDEIFFLRKDVPAQHLLDLLQKEVGLRNSSSSAVSSESQASMQSTNDSKRTEVCKPVQYESSVKREGPLGEVSVFQKQVKQSDQSGALPSEISNITMGSRSTQPDDSSELLHRQLLSEAQKLSRLETKSNKKQQVILTPSCQLFPSSLKNVTERKPSGNINLGSLQWMGPFPPGVEWAHKEQNLLSSQSKMGCNGSYLGFLPQSQSTPGVSLAQLKPNLRDKLEQPSAIESEKENFYQLNTGLTPQPVVPKVDACLSEEANQCDEDALQTSAEVQFLPSLNYLQKIDAWRAKQNDSPTLKEFNGVSSKNKSHDAVSNPLKQVFTQQTGTLQQPSVTSATHQNATHSSSSAPSGSSSPRRGEAVGSAPCDKDNCGSAAPHSPFGRSQSHSSLSTVVMSINKHQQREVPPDMDRTQSQDDAPHHHRSSAAIQTSPIMNLGLFSDVSFDQTLSSSQDSYSEVKVVASVGTSSVVSLELDNYAPYWTSKQSTPPPPPKSQELNIDERIPLYLQNLGIDQTPSKILTPFAPRGPIREPEFSPTDLVTIKGSTGTPSRSTQPSEGGSPHKEEFSRSSILSVDSSVSVPFSLDSLGLAVSVPGQVRASSLSNIEAIQSESRLVPSLQPNEGFQFSLQPSQQQRDDRQAVSQLPKHSDSDTSLTPEARVVESNSNSPFQSSQSMDQDAENSFVSTNAMSEIRKLISHAENISTGSSTTSSAALLNPLFPNEDIFKSLHPKTSRIQESSFASRSTDGDPRTRSSLLWAKSSSDSMLTLEKTKQTSAGHESMTSSQQPDNNSSTHAVTTLPATVPYNIPQESTMGSSVETSLAISKSARRTEPEGCSAIPPDNIPTQPQVMKPSPAASPQQQPNSTSSDRGGVSEEEESSALPAVHSPPSSSVIEDADQEAMSDGSSESSLAVRVAKLLRSESPATMMSSTPSVTDQEENKTKEWLKLNGSSQLQDLNVEDRKRIEEIKKELLLRNPIKSQGSTDTESSASSSLQINKELNPPQSAKKFFTLTNVDNQHRLSMKPPESHAQLQSTHHPDLEALVCEIAAREGVTLFTKQRQTFTSITTSTHRHSTSSSTSSAPPLSPAPHPLQLTELFTGPGRPVFTNQPVPPNTDEDEVVSLAQTTNRAQPSVSEARNSFHSRDKSLSSPSNIKNQKRQDTVVGQSEELLPPTQDDLDKTGVRIRPDSAQSFSHYQELSDRTSFVLGIGQKPNQAAGPGSTARPDHVSKVHLTLYPKSNGHTSTSAIQSGLPRQHSVSPRDPASAASSPDEGVGSFSPPERYHRREPERSDTFNMFKSVVAQRWATAASTQPVILQHQTEAAAAGTPTAETPVPVLLPYKPRGSEELFYVPQTEADVSSAEQSDTTMESSHTGSDDAVPPHFSSDVLGNKDPGLDRGVTFRHAEGIYSKRLKAVTFKMQSPEDRVDASAATDGVVPAAIQTLKPFTPFTGAPSQNTHKISTRNQGTSPVQYLQYKPPETSHERFHRVHVETVPPSVSQRRRQSQLDPESSSSSLDHLWQKFCNQWTAEVSRPTRDREASLLKRLERLSRLIPHTKTDTQGQDYHQEEQLGRIQRNKEAHQTIKRSKHDVLTEAEGKVRGVGGPAVRQRLQVEEAEQTGENDGHASISSHSSSQTLRLSPADRDESETSSAPSGSTSTVDTERLIRAFGPHKVQHLRSSSSLSKLYITINKQQEGRERSSERLHDVTPSETIGTDESVAPDSASSSSTVPSHRGPSRALTAKRRVKLVSKSVQTGDLEIVSNGTRRHTRDVGTTFPSPGEARGFGQISSSSNMVRGRRGHKAPGIQKQRKNKQSSSKPYPKGVSWFVSADSLRSETRKENRPAESSACWRQSMAWFEPYSRVSPWRAPLRQKQVHEDRDNQSCSKDQAEPDPAPKTRTVFSGLTRVSLQESLEMHRPEFISRSRQRVMRLALQVEERRHQCGFNRERNMFNQPGRLSRQPKPAGSALLKRAVPRKEMIQRSKQIYETLPEVQQRREEERRKAEYQSYRLNAQLYNKRITNRVLGRRAAWH